MVKMDGSLNEPTPVTRLADRTDIYRIAASLIRGTGVAQNVDPQDVLNLAEFLAGDDF